MIIKPVPAPTQPFAEGVMLMVAITGVAPLLVALNEAIFPLPETGSPIVGSVFVQL